MASFSDCLLACHSALYRYARSLTGSPNDADELLQETYRRALAAKRKPAPVSLDAVRPWAFTIMRRIWLNELRRLNRAHEMFFDDVPMEDYPSTEINVTRRVLISEVRHAIDSLPLTWREVIVLRDIEDFSYSEIAAAIGCPVGTVMSRLSRARAALRPLLLGTPTSHEVRR